MNDFTIDDIAVEAYLYFYPLVLMDITKRQLFLRTRIDREDPAANQFQHARETANDKWRSVVRPNVDTLFSNAWVDLSHGPLVFTLPPSAGRYHMFQMMDMWTDTYAVVGSRTIGDRGVKALLVGPGWNSSDRAGTETIIECPTTTTWIVGRTYTFGGDDNLEAIAFLDGTSLVAVGGSPFPQTGSRFVELNPGSDPIAQVDALTPAQFFEYASELLLREGAHGSDGSVRLRLRQIGIDFHEQFDFSRQTPGVQSALTGAARKARGQIGASLTDSRNTFGCWTMSHGSIGYYGNDYLSRAATARWGIGANPPEDAVYLTSTGDSSGAVTHGSQTYRMHFEPGELPPAHAFWSITAYGEGTFLIPNEPGRFGVRSKDPITFNSDGSLDVFSGPSRPEGCPESNWIPTVDSSLDFLIRLYSPAEKFTEGQWTPPVIERVS
ncbi:MAG: hypothetical protein RLZZ544_275 [Actinomycetota bacterium]|jgi:hypothetical protein